LPQQQQTQGVSIRRFAAEADSTQERAQKQFLKTLLPKTSKKMSNTELKAIVKKRLAERTPLSPKYQKELQERRKEFLKAITYDPKEVEDLHSKVGERERKPFFFFNFFPLSPTSKLFSSLQFKEGIRKISTMRDRYKQLLDSVPRDEKDWPLPYVIAPEVVEEDHGKGHH
jgi:hypothetical protein